MNFLLTDDVQSIRRVRTRPLRVIMPALACTFFASACDLGKTTANLTSGVLWRAQASLQQESDYELAARALPGVLKTVEAFWYVDKKDRRFTEILAQGFCQYALGFVEDEWEIAELGRDLEATDYQAGRATKSYVRGMNYALLLLGETWEKNILGEFDTVRAMLARFKGNRNALMWAGIGLAGTIKMNKDRIDIVAQLPIAKMILEKVEQIDNAKKSQDLGLRVLPLIALGILYSSQGEALGGKPEKAKEYFMKALEVTGDRFLLARVLYARQYAVMIQDRQLFREQLVKVLQTDPAIWPEQRLANEIAHRRARRYLKHEKEWF